MLNLLVETKNDYFSHLSTLLTPLIFEGIQSIYKEAHKTSDGTDILKIFQTYLKRIPKWNKNLIEIETSRIINSSHSYGWLDDLIKATLKSNLIILMYNPTKKIQEKPDSSFYKNILITDVIHKVYIECAREIWNNPYLLYHNYPPIEIKRNQRDCMNIIKECIKEAIRKLLPMKHILKFYLDEDIDVNIYKQYEENDHADNIVSVKKSDDVFNNELEYNSNNNDSRTIGSKILNIIKSDTSDTSDITGVLSNKSSIFEQMDHLVTGKIVSHNNDVFEQIIYSSDNKLNDDIFEHISPLRNKTVSLDYITGSLDNKTSSLDNKIKTILKDNLNDTDLNDYGTSLNELDPKMKYQEIFSNNLR